ncbi:MAG: hypothetical protein CTY10_01480 [Methylotenera sp.]|nr:MAG: hypothetical protein CTY10_01480 [Methylotenera sp.]
MNQLKLNTIQVYASWLFLIAAIAPSLPPFKFLLASSMVFHMLIQIPALVMAGYWLNAQNKPLNSALSLSLSCWLWILFAGMLWMLPISLDKALIYSNWDIFKIITLVLSGMLIKPALAGPKILSLFFVGSSLMMLFSVGHFYQNSESRLCNSYLLVSQQSTGLGLMLLATALLLFALFKLRHDIFEPSLKK